MLSSAVNSLLVSVVVYTTINCTHFLGKKSDDKGSPAYVPSIFSFISSPRKREARQSLGRYHSAKKRALIKQEHYDKEEIQLTTQEEEIVDDVTSDVSISVKT